MANQLQNQILEQGARNAIMKITGILDTSDLPVTSLIHPWDFSGNGADNQSQYFSPSRLRIDYIDYSIQDQLEVTLWWNEESGPPSTPITPLAGRGRMPFWNFGGLWNNDTNSDGAIAISTTGWTSGTQVFTLILELVKRYG